MGQVFYHSVTRAPLDLIKTLNAASKMEGERVKVTVSHFLKVFGKKNTLKLRFKLESIYIETLFYLNYIFNNFLSQFQRQ
jgi:hypothetical protein